MGRAWELSSWAFLFALFWGREAGVATVEAHKKATPLKAEHGFKITF